MRLFCLLSASRGFVSVKQRKYLCVGFERFFYNDYVRAREESFAQAYLYCYAFRFSQTRIRLRLSIPNADKAVCPLMGTKKPPFRVVSKWCPV